MKTAKAHIGQKFGRLTVIAMSHKDKHRRWHVLVKCDCGTEKTVVFSGLSSGGLSSCGCFAREQASINAIHRSKTHGMTGTPTYASWASMIRRCAHPEDNAYGTYDGVTVCPQWRDFENFLADMGVRPNGMSLDRFPDREGDYCPENCRWATPREQALNRKTTRVLEWEGVTYSLKDLAKHVGLERLTLHARLRSGWPLDKALTTPDDGSSRKKRYEVSGVSLTLDEISKIYGISKFTLRTRLASGKTMDEAVVATGREYKNINRTSKKTVVSDSILEI